MFLGFGLSCNLNNLSIFMLDNYDVFCRGFIQNTLNFFRCLTHKSRFIRTDMENKEIKNLLRITLIIGPLSRGPTYGCH